MAAPQVDAAFVKNVEEALKNLYDFEKLQRSPLVTRLRLDPEAGVAPLRQLLLDAIEALKPAAAISQTGKVWRTYWILFHRYVGQFTRAEVATTMGLSIRQVVREEDRSLLLLAGYLCSRYAVSGCAEQTAPLQPAAPAAPDREQELHMLETSLEREVIGIDRCLDMALQTIAPLLTAHSVRVLNNVRADAPPFYAPANILRQAIINALTGCIVAAPGGEIAISDVPGETGKLLIRPRAVEPQRTDSPATGSADNLEMAGRLLQIMDGAMQVLPNNNEQEPFVLLLSVPVAEQALVLAIDDNADALALYERYLTGTRYRLVGCRTPEQGLHLATSLKPALIVLDVMLPGIDGWELLQRLRVDPATQHTPIVICSILPAQQLALALGAAAYMRKPISQSDFLATLDGLTNSRVIESPA